MPDVGAMVRTAKANSGDALVRPIPRLAKRTAEADDGEDASAGRHDRAVLPARAGVKNNRSGKVVLEALDGIAGRR